MVGTGGGERMTEKRMEEISQVLMSYLEKSIADLASQAGLDPVDLLINGFPLSLCQEANARLAAALSELKTEGVIGDYRLVAIPRDNKMIIHINMVSPGHIESFEVTMAAGVI